MSYVNDMAYANDITYVSHMTYVNDRSYVKWYKLRDELRELYENFYEPLFFIIYKDEVETLKINC